MAIGFMEVQLVKAKGLRDTDIFGIYIIMNNCLCLVLFPETPQCFSEIFLKKLKSMDKKFLIHVQ